MVWTCQTRVSPLLAAGVLPLSRRTGAMQMDILSQISVSGNQTPGILCDCPKRVVPGSGMIWEGVFLHSSYRSNRTQPWDQKEIGTGARLSLCSQNTPCNITHVKFYPVTAHWSGFPHDRTKFILTRKCDCKLEVGDYCALFAKIIWADVLMCRQPACNTAVLSQLITPSPAWQSSSDFSKGAS